MVKIRLRRVGKKKQPQYKVVIADSRTARTGKYIEVIGAYNPLVHPMKFEVTETKLFGWLKKGAQPTDTVRSLLQRFGLWLKWSLVKKGTDEAKIAVEMEKWQMMQAEKQRREAEKKTRRKAMRKKKAAEAPATSSTPAPVPAAESTPVT